MNILQKQDNIYCDALPRMAEGIYKAAKVVGSTMGAAGVNVSLEARINPKHLLINDGSTIVEAIELADPIESIGLSFLKEAVARSNSNSGDGSSTTTVLLAKILEEGIKSGISTLEIKRSLEDCLPHIVKSIKEQTKEITAKDIRAVATIAGEDEEVATVLQEIYEKIGKEGIVHLENSGTYETSYSLIEGVRFVDTGYLSPNMKTDGKKALYKSPKILVTKNKISTPNDIDPLLQFLTSDEYVSTFGKQNLVIFTDDMDSSVARSLIELQQSENRKINILIIKAPTLWKSYVFEDFAKVTGATIIEDSTGTRLGKNLKLDWLGTCNTLIVDKEETTVIGTKDISEHIKELGEEGSTDSKRRLSWLTTKTAIIKLGAKSETELSWRRYKTEDAIFSSRAALRGGIVAGGGVCLLNASKTMPDTIGGNIMKVALKAPITQILANAGMLEVGLEGISGNFGYDTKTRELTDMIEKGIVDSAEIVLGAVRNSLGIAATMLTTSAVITLPPPSQEELMNKAVMRPAHFQ